MYNNYENNSQCSQKEIAKDSNEYYAQNYSSETTSAKTQENQIYNQNSYDRVPTSTDASYAQYYNYGNVSNDATTNYYPQDAYYNYNQYYNSYNYSQFYPGYNNYYQTTTDVQNDVRSTTPENKQVVLNDSGIEVTPEQQAKIQAQVYNLNKTASSESSKNDVSNQESRDDEIPQYRPYSPDNSNDESIDEEESKKGSSSSDKNSILKPPKPYLEIIADAILSSDTKMMQLHEIYYYMEKKYEYFAKNVNKSWRNSVRHNLSLNECFCKAGRGTNGKGNYWKIHPACESEFIRGNFRRKNFKKLIRNNENQNNAMMSNMRTIPSLSLSTAASNGQSIPMHFEIPNFASFPMQNFNFNSLPQSYSTQHQTSYSRYHPYQKPY